MKAETLKKSILQYAMQGKLVEQNPDDEPASELLKRIKAEKEQLIKDGKIKKEKPLPTITEDEMPYELPKGWEWVRLGNIINIKSGNFLPSNVMEIGGTIPVYGGNGINGYHNEYLIDKPTLIIGRVGFYCGCVHLSTGKAWVTDNAFIANFSENNININFLKWLLIQAELGRNDNATAQPVVSGKKIYPIIVALPPFAEQQRIVEKLEQILPLIEEYGKNEEKLSELNKTLPDKIKQSILQHAVQGKLVPQNPMDEPASELLKRIKTEKEQLIKDGKIKKEKPLPTITEDEMPYELPKGWEWVRLGNIINIKSGNFLPSNVMEIGGTIPVYGGNGINGYHNEYLIDKPTLIIGRVGFYCGCVHLSTGKAWVTDNAFIANFSENNININFLKWLLIQAELGRNDNATAQPVVSGKKIYPIIVALPPFAEQQRIVDKIEELMKIIDKLKV